LNSLHSKQFEVLYNSHLPQPVLRQGEQISLLISGIKVFDKSHIKALSKHFVLEAHTLQSVGQERHKFYFFQ